MLSTKSEVSVDDKTFFSLSSTKWGFFVDKIFLYRVSSTKSGVSVDDKTFFSLSSTK